MTEGYHPQQPQPEVYYEEQAPAAAPAFLPICLIAGSVILFFSYQLSVLVHDGNKLVQAKEQQEENLANLEKQLAARKGQLGPLEESRSKLISFARDLLELAKTDPDAALVTKAHKLQEQSPPARE